MNYLFSTRSLGIAALVAAAFMLPGITHACGMYDLELKKTGPATIKAGEALSYTINVTQPKPEAIAVNLVVRDAIPAGLTFDASATRIENGTNILDKTVQFAGKPLRIIVKQTVVCAQEGSAVVCRINQLQKEWGTVKIHLSFKMSAPLRCDIVTNTASVTARENGYNEKEGNPANNTSTVKTKVTGCETPTPTPKITPTPTPVITPTPTPTPSVSPSPTPEASPTPTPTPEAEATPTPSPTPKPRVAAAVTKKVTPPPVVVAVPVTAKTGAGMIASFSTLIGAAGMAFVVRKSA